METTAMRSRAFHIGVVSGRLLANGHVPLIRAAWRRTRNATSWARSIGFGFTVIASPGAVGSGTLTGATAGAGLAGGGSTVVVPLAVAFA
jgi:hypothetical protein